MQLTSMLMLVTTGVTLFSLGLMVFLFRLDMHHLAFIVLLVSVSTSLIVLIVIVIEFNPEQILERDAKITGI